MIDFYLYQSNPAKDDSIKAHPHKKEFERHVKSLEFKNQGKFQVNVHFCDDVQAVPNPLPVPPHGKKATVNVDPTADGVYPCWLEIVYSDCPACGRKLKEKLLAKPSSSLAGPLYATSSNPEGTGDGGGGDSDGDPIIIINP